MKVPKSALSGGYTRVPDSFFDAPVSPLAQLLLCNLCKFANQDGESWYSYEQLGEIIGRSKASISGYVKELREAGYINCIRQKTRMGFNYRLKIKINGWGDIVKYWSELATKARQKIAPTKADVKKHTPPPAASRSVPERSTMTLSDTPNPGIKAPVQPAECSVQSVERIDPKGLNYTHITQDSCATAPAKWSREDEIAWKDFRPSDNDPASQWHRDPNPDLLHRAISCAERLNETSGLPRRPEMRSAVVEELVKFARQKKLSVTTDEIEASAEAVLECISTLPALRSAIDALDKSWAPHWRRLSSPTQIKSALKGISRHEGLTPEDLQRLLIFRSRAHAARIWIKRYHSTQKSISEPSKPPVRTISRQSRLEVCYA